MGGPWDLGTPRGEEGTPWGLGGGSPGMWGCTEVKRGAPLSCGGVLGCEGDFTLGVGVPWGDEGALWGTEIL